MNQFLYASEAASSRSQLKQGKLLTISGLAWTCRQLLKEVADKAVEWSDLTEGVAEWEEWREESVEDTCLRSRRNPSEERKLWKILDELDKEQVKAAELKAKKDAKKVCQARASTVCIYISGPKG